MPPAFAVWDGRDGESPGPGPNGSRIDRCFRRSPSIPFRIPATPGDYNLLGITPGPDGNVWFTDLNTGTIDSVTPTGQVTPYPLP